MGYAGDGRPLQKAAPGPARGPLEALYASVDRATAEVARRSGLGCPPGCGACCLSPEVRASVLEMQPMAEHLWECGQAGAVLEQLEAAAVGAPCVLYAAEPGDARRGQCTRYAHRPLVCRLFGFAAVRDKAGQPRLAVCKVHRETDPEAVRNAEAAVAAGRDVPVFGDYTAQLQGLAAPEELELLPINEALRRAVEKAGLRAAVQGAAGDCG